MTTMHVNVPAHVSKLLINYNGQEYALDFTQPAQPPQPTTPKRTNYERLLELLGDHRLHYRLDIENALGFSQKQLTMTLSEMRAKGHVIEAVSIHANKPHFYRLTPTTADEQHTPTHTACNFGG